MRKCDGSVAVPAPPSFSLAIPVTPFLVVPQAVKIWLSVSTVKVLPSEECPLSVLANDPPAGMLAVPPLSCGRSNPPVPPAPETMSKPEKFTGEVANLASVAPDAFLSFHLKVRVCGFEASAARAVQLLALVSLVVIVVVDEAAPVMVLPAGRFVAVLEQPETFNASAAVKV